MFYVRSVTVDCTDPYRQALFWSEVTGWQEDSHDPNNPGDPEGGSSPHRDSACCSPRCLGASRQCQELMPTTSAAILGTAGMRE
jgi:Glyoxalase-like domain